MRQALFLGFAALVVGFGISSAAEAAMCGRSCNSGGRYIPGPPSVCADNGLNYCGSSRGGGGGGVGVVVGPGGVGVVGPRVVGPREGCRTVTVTRPDGTRITRRDC